MKGNSRSLEETVKGKRALTPKILFSGVSALVLIIIGTLLLIPQLHSQPTQPLTNTQPPTPTDPAPLDASPALGPQTAPVTIIEYADFGCPSCWYWHKKGILEQLRAKYGDQIHFVWRDFPVITLLSPKAAEAGQCAHEQGKFWEFHDAVYKHDGKIEANDLQAYAAEMSLDVAKFKDCVTSRRYRERVNAEQTEAFGLGFNGTPAFLINDQRLVGPQSLADFSSRIDLLLVTKK